MKKDLLIQKMVKIAQTQQLLLKKIANDMDEDDFDQIMSKENDEYFKVELLGKIEKLKELGKIYKKKYNHISDLLQDPNINNMSHIYGTQYEEAELLMNLRGFYFRTCETLAKRIMDIKKDS